MTTLKDRFKTFASHMGFKSIRSFEAEIELPNGYVNNVKNITKARRFQIQAAFPDLNIDWLISGEGEMLRENEEGSVLKIPLHVANVQNNNNSPHSVQFANGVNSTTQRDDRTAGVPNGDKMVPLVPTELYHKENVDIYQELMSIRINGVELLPQFQVFAEYNLYVRVLDESMSPEYKSGDVLAIRAMDISERIISGNLYILDLKRSGLLFRILKDRNDEYECIALGDRNRYENIFVKKTDIFRVYSVKGMFRICS